MSAHEWIWGRELEHTARYTCGICSLNTIRFRESPEDTRYYWPVLRLPRKMSEPACLGFDVLGADPLAETLRTFLADGIPVERALELARGVLA